MSASDLAYDIDALYVDTSTRVLLMLHSFLLVQIRLREINNTDVSRHVVHKDAIARQLDTRNLNYPKQLPEEVDITSVFPVIALD